MRRQITANHVSAYFGRVEAHLPTLADEATRKSFLTREIAKWQQNYRAFAAKVDAGKETSPGVTAFDYATTIAELNILLARRGK